MAEVQRIEEATANGVRAGAVVSTLSQAVQERATFVEIKLDLPSYRISIADNGRGIPAEKLQSLVATACATSKASSTEEMQHASTYGFRGEALYSLGLTSVLEIQSRCAGKESHAKVVRDGQTLHFGPARAPTRMGTIVTLRDAFFKWPVRRKAANEVTEMMHIKEHVSRMALVNNNVAITVLDSAKSKVVVKAAATGSVTRTFAQVFSSDKLSLARKLTFEFKQFRLTGYLSPPSSTACHWSKEFQFVYVNCKSIRRLDFLQKAINTAFAPCLALLHGRGGADGQGVVRRVRNPNASSGQRQELFPVFVLNLECPHNEVDIMVEAEKTWVEFSDWTAAKNACIAMLLAFLPHFPHAVPSSVLRDLRRAFHKHEGDEAWTTASPPPALGRTSPAPAPSPSPSPMRLDVPDVEMFSDVGVGSPLNSCVWMGQDRQSSRTREGAGEAMEFQGEGIRAEGILYPSPASRFGARDSGPSSMTNLSFSPISGDIDGSTVSPHFSTRGTSRHPNDAHPIGLPYFAHLDERGHVSSRESRHPRRLALGERTGGGRGGSHAFDPRVAPKVNEAGTLHPSATRYGHGEWTATDDGDVRIKDGALTEQEQEPCGYVEGGGCAAEAPGVRSETTNLLPPQRPPPLEPVHGPQLASRGTCAKVERGGSSGRRWQVSGSPPSGGWLRYLPGVAQEMRLGEELDQGESDVVGGGNTLNLSRLFAYAFPDNDRHPGRLPEPTRESNSHQSEILGGVGGGERSTCSPRLKGAAGANLGSRHIPSSSPRVLPRDSAGDATTNKKTLVGVTVRRPPSPQFSFMTEECSLNANTPPATSPRQRAPLKAQQQEVQETSCVNRVDLRANDVQQQQAVPSRGPFGTTMHCDDDADIPPPLASIVDETAPLRSVERSPPSTDVGRMTSSSGTGLPVRTPPRSRKRRRPVMLTASRAVALRDSPSLPLAIVCTEDTVQKRPLSAGDHDASSPDRENGVGLGDAWLGWTCDRGRARNRWWGAQGGDTPASTGDETALGALRLFQVDDDVAEVGGHEALWDDANIRRDRMVQKNVGGGAATARYKRAKAGDGTRSESPGTGRRDTDVPCETEASKRSAGGSPPTAAAAGGDEVCHAEGGGRRGVGDSNKKDRTRAVDAALAYDQDELGGDGLAQDSFGIFEPGTVADVLGKFMATEECDSCHVSDSGGAAVYSPQGPGGSRARKGEHAAAVARYASGARERPISQVLQAGQDEIGAGAGAVAVSVTPEELGQACLIGQAGRKFVLLRARTGAILCVDQHAADERIKLEELEREVFGEGRDSRNVKKLQLNPPESVLVTQSDVELLEQHRKTLSSWKFELEVKQGVGGRAPVATLIAVLVVCGVRLSLQDLVGFLHYLRESVEPGSLAGWLRPPQVQHILNYKACHSAIRFGDLLSSSECHELIRKLAACARPFFCAHGRPSVVPLCVLAGAVPSSKSARGSLGKLGGGRWAAVGRKSRRLTG